MAEVNCNLVFTSITSQQLSGYMFIVGAGHSALFEVHAHPLMLISTHNHHAIIVCTECEQKRPWKAHKTSTNSCSDSRHRVQPTASSAYTGCYIGKNYSREQCTHTHTHGCTNPYTYAHVNQISLSYLDDKTGITVCNFGLEGRPYVLNEKAEERHLGNGTLKEERVGEGWFMTSKWLAHYKFITKTRPWISNKRLLHLTKTILIYQERLWQKRRKRSTECRHVLEQSHSYQYQSIPITTTAQHSKQHHSLPMGTWTREWDYCKNKPVTWPQLLTCTCRKH